MKNELKLKINNLNVDNIYEFMVISKNKRMNSIVEFVLNFMKWKQKKKAKKKMFQ